jgi:SPP1 family predicted phage head-tail adaptor
MIINGTSTNPGDLRQKVTLVKRAVSMETGGFQGRGTLNVADVWAHWENVHGSEVWQAQTVHAISPATVRIRYRSDIDSTWLIILAGQAYEIVGMDDIFNRHEYIELKVMKVSAG